jgi:putative ABC transport system permease protein
MAVAFGQTDFQIIHHFNPRSLVIAYTLGMVFTFVVVALSAWRVSRINIVRAIRDLPEPPSTGRSWKGGGIRVLLLLLGFLLTAVGIQAAQFFPFMLGTSLIIIGAALLARWAGLRDRLVFTFAGVTLLLWWLLPSDIYDRLFPFLPEMKMGIEIFFLTGIMIVAGAVWTVIYNSDILLAAIIALIGRVRWLTPVLKTAISYPLHHKFRTGMALAMFSLVIFTMIFMSVMISASTAVFQDVERLSGGFHIRALTSYINPVPDLRAALEEGGEVASDDFAVIAAQSVVQAEVRQAGAASPEWHNYFLQGVDAAYLDNVTYEFALIAEGYDSPRQVWQALRDEPGLAVVDYTLVPSRANFNVGMELPEFQLEGFYVEDDILPPVEIEVRDRVTQQVSRLRVIGVLEPTAFFSLGIYTSRSTLDTVISQPLPPAIYWLRAKPGADVRQLSLALERQFLEHGMQTRVLQEIIQENSRINRMMNGLLQGFMGLGLVVGIAALGVIAARSVVERRQQIGMLRAIGFQRGMVQLSFLLESSFVALLGIVIGIVLGLWLSYEVVGYIARDIQGFRFQIPWLNILIIALIAYGASLLTTFLPAHQASRIYPAAALRYE